VLDIVNGYSLTPFAAVEAARRGTRGRIAARVPNTCRAVGNGFAETIADTTIALKGDLARR